MKTTEFYDVKVDDKVVSRSQDVLRGIERNAPELNSENTTLSQVSKLVVIFIFTCHCFIDSHVKVCILNHIEIKV